MATPRFRPLLITMALALGGAGLAAAAAAHAAAAPTAARSGAGDCIARHPSVYGEYQAVYTAGCSGHDEPELDPVSSLAGSARNLTWTVVLPSDGSVPVSSVGPTFWFGGTVTNPNKNALFGQAFLEVQFYPDSIVSNCTPSGGFNVTHAPDKFSVCSPTWQLSPNFHESAAFNAELFNGSTSQPLVMNAGNTVKIHFYVGAPGPGWNINVTDVTTGQSGTITLNSKYGPMLPAFGKQQIGNALGWGLVDDTPNSFVWEIGHTSPFTKPASQFCVPGQTFCDSYDTAHWLGSARRRSSRSPSPTVPLPRSGRRSATSAARPKSTSSARHTAGPTAAIRGSRSTEPVTRSPTEPTIRARSSTTTWPTSSSRP